MELFDLFFSTAAGHWLLNHVDFWQLFVVCILKLLAVILFGEGIVSMFKMVNWRFIGRKVGFQVGEAYVWQ